MLVGERCLDGPAGTVGAGWEEVSVDTESESEAETPITGGFAVLVVVALPALVVIRRAYGVIEIEVGS